MGKCVSPDFTNGMTKVGVFVNLKVVGVFCFYIYLLVCFVHMRLLCVYVDMCVSMFVEVREQLMGNGSLLLPCRFWELNSGHQALWEAFIHPAISLAPDMKGFDPA